MISKFRNTTLTNSIEFANSKELIKFFTNGEFDLELNANGKLTEKFLYNFKKRLLWQNLSYFYNLPEDFIRDFHDKIDWESVSKYQNLSENFLKEFKDKIYWSELVKHQKLSKELIKYLQRDALVKMMCNKLSDDLHQKAQNKYKQVILEFTEKYNLPIKLPSLFRGPCGK